MTRACRPIAQSIALQPTPPRPHQVLPHRITAPHGGNRRPDDPDANDPTGAGKLAGSNLDCSFEDVPIDPNNAVETANMRRLIIDEMQKLKAQQAADAASEAGAR
jgi:hypothetical protein